MCSKFSDNDAAHKAGREESSGFQQNEFKLKVYISNVDYDNNYQSLEHMMQLSS